MSTVIKPETADQVREAVAWALAAGEPLEVLGAGSKQRLGRPVQAAHGLDLSGLAGVSLYEPEELVLTAAAGTRLREIEKLLAEARQHLGFEPADYGKLLGGEAGAQTLGGVIACNLAGPRRIKDGAARDHFLGFKAVSGRGEDFKSGGRVVKNVTGYDLSKLLAGSYGTLAAMTEITVKVLPVPEKTRTVLVFGLDDKKAIAALGEALASAHEVSGAAHLPAPLAGRSAVSYVKGAGAAVTAVRVEGPAPSAEYRCAALREMLGRLGEVEELHGKNSSVLWREVRDVSYLAEPSQRVVWRLSLPPAAGPAAVAAITRKLPAEYFFDWGGGLVWLSPLEEIGAGDKTMRGALRRPGGHATLVRAPADIRAAVPVFQPEAKGVAGLTRRIKDSFDPKGVLNPGRMYAGV